MSIDSSLAKRSMDAMRNSMTTFGLLLYKGWLIRKRHWVQTLSLRIIIPLVVLIGIKTLRDLNSHLWIINQNDSNDRMIKTVSWTPKFNFDKDLYFFPKNNETENVMKLVTECMKLRKSSLVIGCESEAMMEEKLKQDRRQIPYKHIVIDFGKYQGNSTKNIKYKIKHFEEMSLKLFSRDTFDSTSPYNEITGFVAVQVCLDNSFIQYVAPNAVLPKLRVQQIPEHPRPKKSIREDIMLFLYRLIIGLMLVIAVNGEIGLAIQEKLTGINGLMAINGVKLYKNLMSWVLSGVIFSNFYLIPFITTAKFSFNSDIRAYLSVGNPFIFWLFFMVHVGHIMSLGMHVASYCSKRSFTYWLLIALYMIPMWAEELKDKLVTPLGILFPSILFQRFFMESDILEFHSDGIRWGTLFSFQDSIGNVMDSAGFAVIYSIIGIILHFTMCIYVDDIKTGKYDIKQYLFYLIQWIRKRNDRSAQNATAFEREMENFEEIPNHVLAPGIRIHKLEKIYSTHLLGPMNIRALRGISLDFYEGEITALLGDTGAGKSTLMSILTGVINPTRGNVFIDGRSNMKQGALQSDIGLCPQEDIFFPDLTVFEQIKFFGLLKKGNANKEILSGEVNILLEKLRMKDQANSYPEQLSKSQKRKLCLAIALIGDGSTLILDEPTSGMDTETRRETWDLIMEMRGKKTILISTHDIEEADIIADRIAIIHGGRIKAFGTPMYLKNKQGQGYMEVALSTKTERDISKIKSLLPPGTQELGVTEDKIILNVPCTESLPESLDLIQQQKKQLGIIGVNASLVTLENTFFNMTTKDERKVVENDLNETPFHQLEGFPLLKQRVWGLFVKNFTYCTKQPSMLFMMFVFPLVLNLLVISFLKNPDDSIVLTVTPNLYQSSKFLYTSKVNQSYGEKYEKFLKGFGKDAIQIDPQIGMHRGFVEESKKMKPLEYQRTYIASAEFFDNNGKVVANGLYSSHASHSLPLTINILSNTFIKFLKDDNYSIELSVQKFPEATSEKIDANHYELMQSVVFLCYFFWSLTIFVSFPLHERVTNIKHLQRIIGVDTFTYWGSMFVFDFIKFLAMAFCVILEFFLLDRICEIQLVQAGELGVMTLIILLFGMNNILMAYILSFMNRGRRTIIIILYIIPYIAFIVIDRMSENNNDVGLIKGIFNLIPQFNFISSGVDFYHIGSRKAKCRRQQIKFHDKKDSDCTETYFTKSQNRGLAYLAVTPLLYLIVLVGLEEKIHLKLMNKLTQLRRNKAPKSTTTDELVQKEKDLILENMGKTSGSSGNPSTDDQPLFMASGLSKYYGNSLAVRDVSLRVRQGECVGLLGLNGGGKSTILEILTQEVLPNTGTIHLKGIPTNKNYQQYLSQLGYCPQSPALIESLNTLEHLYLFASIRGIPRDRIESEVNKWIDRLNLHSCKDQPSSTYSTSNKRKLNTAMALIGNPVLVLLDEPTTGVDPVARKSMREVIQQCQKLGQGMILTSQSIKECEDLCNRIVIMVGGEFVRIGTSQELKERFGTGYHISIKLNPARSLTGINRIIQRLQTELTGHIIYESSKKIEYHVTGSPTTWKKMYSTMNELKDDYQSIEDFAIESGIPEELFIHFARTAENSTSFIISTTPESETSL